MVWQGEHFKPNFRANAGIACPGCGAKRAQPRAAKTGIRAGSQDLLRGRAMTHGKHADGQARTPFVSMDWERLNTHMGSRFPEFTWELRSEEHTSELQSL